MRYVAVSLLLFTLIIVPGPVLAGGSSTLVEVLSIDSSGGDNYRLTVAPVDPTDRDPYISQCPRFTVIGSYRRLAGFELSRPPIVTHSAHIRALAYLRSALSSHSRIFLGWVGEGFHVSDPSDRCV